MKVMFRKSILLLLFATGLVSVVIAQNTSPAPIRFNFKDLFLIKEYRISVNESNAERMIITVYDSLGQVDEKINGGYKFVINDYITDLNFNSGVAAYTMKKDAGFFYLKHENREGLFTKLTYVYNGRAIAIPLWWLLLLPIAIILIVWLMKRLFMAAAIVLVIAFLLMSGLSFDLLGSIFSDAFNALFN